LHEAILIKTSGEAMSKRTCCNPHQRVRKLASAKGLCKFPRVILNPSSIGCVTGYQPNPRVVQVTRGFAPKIAKRGLEPSPVPAGFSVLGHYTQPNNRPHPRRARHFRHRNNPCPTPRLRPRLVQPRRRRLLLAPHGARRLQGGRQGGHIHIGQTFMMRACR
jgi:hypothetical protein